MTAAGRQLAAAAQAIPPAAATLSRSLAHTRVISRADRVSAACHLHGIAGFLAGDINDTGHAARDCWAREFTGRDGGPLAAAAHAAACAVQDAANVTIPVRAVGGLRDEPSPRARCLAASAALWTAARRYGKLARDLRRQQQDPQVPDFAVIMEAFRAGLRPLSVALAWAGPRLDGVDPDPASPWAEGYSGSMPEAYAQAARHALRAAQLLGPVCDQMEADAAWWRSRSGAR